VLAAIAVPGGTVEVLSGEGLDLQAARERASRARQKLQDEVARVAGKLANPGFVAKAPAAVVEGERSKLEQLQSELEAL
jgi:valyl-tRNA synthetase